MSFIVGPTSWWIRSKEAVDYYARSCPLGTVLPDGSITYCRAGGLAWIWAPPHTSSREQWASGRYNTVYVGNTSLNSCVCLWTQHCARLISYGFNPCDWFIPDRDQMVSIFRCITYTNCTWYINLPQCYVGCSACIVGQANPNYWSTCEINCCGASGIELNGACTACYLDSCGKTVNGWVRSVRCIIL